MKPKTSAKTPSRSRKRTDARKESKTGSDTTVIESSPLKVQWNIFASLGWFVLGMPLAAQVPRLYLNQGSMFDFVALFILSTTTGLIVWNLVVSIRLFLRSGTTLPALPLTLTQVVLATLLYFQIYCSFGSTCFSFEGTPRIWNWFGFSVVHAIRAGDVADSIEAFGLQFQMIQSASHVVAVSLILFHLIVNFFAVGLLLNFISFISPKIKRLDRDFVILFILIMIANVAIQGWPVWDILLWPIDNLLRVVDLFDVMEIYHVRLHEVPRTAWEGTLTLTCRILMSLALAGLYAKYVHGFSLRRMGGFGLGAESLKTISKNDRSKRIRRIAKRRLTELKTEEANASRLLRNQFGNLPSVVAISVLCVLCIVSLLVAELQLKKNVRLAIVSTHSLYEKQAYRSLVAIQMMGPIATSAIPDVKEQLFRSNTQIRIQAIKALASMGPEGIAAASAMVDDADSDVALQAIEILQTKGPAAGIELVKGLNSNNSQIRDATRKAILELGPDSVEHAVRNLAPENIGRALVLFELVEPDRWHLHNTLYGYFNEVVACREEIEQLRDPETRGDFTERLPYFKKLRKVDDVHFPLLVEQLLLTDAKFHDKYLAQLRRNNGELALQYIASRMENGTSRERQRLTRVLPQVSRAMIPEILKLLRDPDVRVRYAAMIALGEIGFWNVHHAGFQIDTDVIDNIKSSTKNSEARAAAEKVLSDAKSKRAQPLRD